MEKFPDNFNNNDIRTRIFSKETAYGLSQLTRLKEQRAKIVAKVESSFGEQYVVLSIPDALCREMKCKLAKELYDRFPQLEYRWVVEYADVDEFKPVNKDKPQASFEYRIKFR